MANAVAIVTGGGRGIGRAISLRLARTGTAVVVVDIDGGSAAATVDAIVDGGGVAHAVEIDIADAEGMAGAIAEAEDRFGRLDVLVNNAAAFEPVVHEGDLDAVSTSLEVWDRTMAVNLRAPFVASKHAIPLMLRGGGGCIVNISSTAAFLGDVNHVAYSASKAGMQALTRAVATSHGARGIRTNAIAVGVVLTETARRNVDPTMFEAYARHRLTAPVGTPEQVAAVVELLVSDDGAYILGQTIVIDGGATAHQPWYRDAAIVHPTCFGSDGLPGATVVDRAPA